MKKVIVFGIGITGKASIEALKLKDYDVLIYDDRELNFILSELSFLKIDESKILKNIDLIRWDEIEFVLRSPGIKNTHRLIESAIENDIEVISDIELAYRFYGGDRFIAITGTNGKTTITSLITEILKKNNIKAKSAGNIGTGILLDMLNEDEDTIYIIEMSSFQLDSTYMFRPKVAVISNITEDHIDWHGSFEAYKDAKLKIFKNQLETDILILNKDDEILKDVKSKSKILYYSTKEKSDAYLQDDLIYVMGSSIKTSDVKLLGKHNMKNIMAAILAIKEYINDIAKIFETVKSFNSIEHRMEYVTSINGVKYFNDSKGTNVESTKVALNSFKHNVLLIAGGYDKDSNYDNLFMNNKNIKLLVLFGVTKYKIEKCAKKHNIKEIKIVEDLEEAVKLSFDKSVNGDTVLFSPACASWDMYKNYIERGNHFKKIVMDLYEKEI